MVYTKCVCPHLSIIVQVSQIETTYSIHSGKERGMHLRPHNIVHIVRIVFKRAQWFVLLQQGEREKIVYGKEKCGGLKQESKAGRKEEKERQREKVSRLSGAAAALGPVWKQAN